MSFLLQASMTSSAQQHEQRLAETQAEVQEATEAAQHAQAAEAEATAAADKVAASSAAFESVRADATAAAQRCQQVFDNFTKVIAGARHELSTHAQTLQQTIKDQITAAVHHEVTAATQQFPANWKSLQSVATEARKLLEGVDQEIRNSVEYAVCGAKAEIVSAAIEAAVAATAMQNLGASDQAGTSQVEHT